MIMPAIGALFFIYFMGLPFHVNIFGWQCPTFCILVFVILIMAISIICMGGILALVITDAIQGTEYFPPVFARPLIFVYVHRQDNRCLESKTTHVHALLLTDF